MMTRTRLLRSVVPVAVALAVLGALRPVPARARVVESQTVVSAGDSIEFDLSSTEGCIESHLFGVVGQHVIRPGNQASAGGQIFYIREDECTGEYLAGINQSFDIESGGFSIHGDLESGTAQFTTSAIDQVTQEVVVVSIDVTVTANGDKVHNHGQGRFGIPDIVEIISEFSEWSRPAVVTGRFNVGTVGGSASSDGTMIRGRATLTLKSFGPPFPRSN